MNTYSCGKERKITDPEEFGSSFSCECGRVHSTEIQSEKKIDGKESLKQGSTSVFTTIKSWIVKLLTNVKTTRNVVLLSIKKGWSRLGFSKDTHYEILDSKSAPSRPVNRRKESVPIVKTTNKKVPVEYVTAEEKSLNTRLASALLGDKAKLDNMLRHYKKKYQNLSILELKKKILTDLDRDRK